MEQQQRRISPRAAISTPSTPQHIRHNHHRNHHPHHHLVGNNKPNNDDLLESSSKSGGAPLRRFASNVSLAGSQTLETLPEIHSLQDFSAVVAVVNNKVTSDMKISSGAITSGTKKGLLERRGSTASLTIDLGLSCAPQVDGGATCSDANKAKSASNLSLSMAGGGGDYSDVYCDCDCCYDNTADECATDTCTTDENASSNGFFNSKNESDCSNKTDLWPARTAKSKSPLHHLCRPRPLTTVVMTTTSPAAAAAGITDVSAGTITTHHRRKSLSNDNLYIPPRGSGRRLCLGGSTGICNTDSSGVGNKNLSEDFRLHLHHLRFLRTAGRPMSVDDIRAACDPNRLALLHKEFLEVPLNIQEKCLVSGSQTKNRYKGLHPNEQTRVRLPEPRPYINANYIKGPGYQDVAYIATQGPMAHTCADFWHMVWHEKATRIVMLTDLVEKGRNKCELYFPLGDDNQHGDQSQSSHTAQHQCGHYVTTLTRPVETVGECQIRHLQLSNGGDEAKRHVRHYWYRGWRDHKMASPRHLLQLALHLLDNDNDVTVDSPVVVHCSAGIGRTGCFIGVLNAIRQLRGNGDTGADVMAILCSLRLDRGGMVQTAGQYELVFRVLTAYFDRLQNVDRSDGERGHDFESDDD